MPVKLDLFVLCVLKLVRYLVMISVLLNQTSNSIAPSFFFCYRLHDVIKVRKFELKVDDIWVNRGASI